MIQEYSILVGAIASSVTIAAVFATIIKYLGRAGVVEELADRLGVDLLEVLGGWETVIGNEAPGEVTAHLGEMANDEDCPLEVSDLVTLASNEAEPEMLIEAGLMGEEVDRLDLLGNQLSDLDLEALVSARGVWQDPIERVVQLEDSREVAYAWLLSDDSTEEDRASLANEIESTFIDETYSEPESLHFIVSGVDEISRLDSETVERYVKPWLKEQREDK